MYSLCIFLKSLILDDNHEVSVINKKKWKEHTRKFYHSLNGKVKETNINYVTKKRCKKRNGVVASFGKQKVIKKGIWKK